MGYSFYGGRQGESFKIVRNFMSVDEMTEKFGPNTIRVPARSTIVFVAE